MSTAGRISIVVRTLNEARHLPELLESVHHQRGISTPVEVIVVDSGSTDRTLEIAAEYGCRIVHITRQEFTFGRSLNVGCDAATGEFLVFVSGHCIPLADTWLRDLTAPLASGSCVYTYGRQVGGTESRFSECQLFVKYFPEASKIPQDGFFCNNANSALPRRTWLEHKFDEELTGLEDMELAQRLLASGGRIGYVAEAGVRHLHDETWRQVRRRYEREAIALQHIMPQVHISFSDFVRYAVSAILLDSAEALRTRQLFSRALEIVMFRSLQYWGAYRGNNDHRKLSQKAKEAYFYPR